MRMLLALRLVKTSVGLVEMFYGQFHKSKEQNIFTNLLKVVFFFLHLFLLLFVYLQIKELHAKAKVEWKEMEERHHLVQNKVT